MTHDPSASCFVRSQGDHKTPCARCLAKPGALSARAVKIRLRSPRCDPKVPTVFQRLARNTQGKQSCLSRFLCRLKRFQARSGPKQRTGSTTMLCCMPSSTLSVFKRLHSREDTSFEECRLSRAFVCGVWAKVCTQAQPSCAQYTSP